MEIYLTVNTKIESFLKDNKLTRTLVSTLFIFECVWTKNMFIIVIDLLLLLLLLKNPIEFASNILSS